MLQGISKDLDKQANPRVLSGMMLRTTKLAMDTFIEHLSGAIIAMALSGSAVRN
jgi:hypothetical protein